MPSVDPQETPAELEPGARLLERYVIIDRVGSGGMASIWRATDERLDRVVCVKLLRLLLEGSGSGSRVGKSEGRNVYQATYTHFLQEALALSRLQHPNTLRIYDFGYTEDGRPYQISEFLDGGNLETQVKASGRFFEIETLGVLERVCGAVAEAHEHGIIHRDIKPSNILFARVARSGGRDGGFQLMPKLADFGIASSRLRRAGEVKSGDGDGASAHGAGRSTPVASSVALFSPRWAAPEQLAGGDEGPATDVYALGLVTAFMLTGRALFADRDVRAHFDDRIRSDHFVDARLAALALEEPVRALLLRAMLSDPKARIPSPIAFFDEARAVLSASTPHPPPSRRPYESITLVVDVGDQEAREVAPPEHVEMVGGRPVRVVAANEKLDFTVPLAPLHEGAHPPVLRFRATLVPSSGEGYALHLKGLNCFVTRPGMRPTPAITATGDGLADLVSGDREVLGTVRWSFGRPADAVGPGAGRVFAVGAGELMVSFQEAAQAIAIDLGPEREVVVMGRR